MHAVNQYKDKGHVQILDLEIALAFLIIFIYVCFIYWPILKVYMDGPPATS